MNFWGWLLAVALVIGVPVGTIKLILFLRERQERLDEEQQALEFDDWKEQRGYSYTDNGVTPPVAQPTSKPVKQETSYVPSAPKALSYPSTTTPQHQSRTNYDDGVKEREERELREQRERERRYYDESYYYGVGTVAPNADLLLAAAVLQSLESQNSEQYLPLTDDNATQQTDGQIQSDTSLQSVAELGHDVAASTYETPVYETPEVKIDTTPTVNYDVQSSGNNLDASIDWNQSDTSSNNTATVDWNQDN